MDAPDDSTLATLEARLAMVEAHEEIRQLASRYAAALDSRDVAAMVELFVEDVAIGDGRTGRVALAEFFDDVLRPFTTTFHLIGNHVIDVTSPDRATGVVYCRPEHEVGDRWITMPLQYWDRYERRDGRWYFRSRSPKAFYATDVGERPQDVPGRFAFPGNPMFTGAELPERFETWQQYWGES